MDLKSGIPTVDETQKGTARHTLIDTEEAGEAEMEHDDLDTEEADLDDEDEGKNIFLQNYK